MTFLCIELFELSFQIISGFAVWSWRLKADLVQNISVSVAKLVHLKLQRCLIQVLDDGQV